MAQYDGSIRINTEINSKNANAQLMSLQNRIVKTADKINSLRSKMDALKDTKVPTKEYQDISSQIEKAEQKFNKLLEKQEQMQREGKDNGIAWRRLNDQIDEIGNEIRYAKGELQGLVDTGKAFVLGSSTQEYSNLSKQLQYLESDYSTLIQRRNEFAQRHNIQDGGYERLHAASEELKNTVSRLLHPIESMKSSFSSAIENMKERAAGIAATIINGIVHPFQTMKTIAGKAISGTSRLLSGMASTAKKVGSAVKNIVSMLKKAASSMFSFGKSTKSSNNILQSGFKNILKYGLGIRSFYVLINKFRTAVKEGFGNLTQYSEPVNSALSSLKSSLGQLKNSLATAFAPILTAIAPALTLFIDMVSRAVTAVGMLIAALTGQKSFVKATKVQQGYADSLGGTAKAAKDANKQLSSLDKLNNLSSNDSGGGGNGGGGGAGSGDMFETVDIPSQIGNLADMIKDAWKKADFKEIGALIGTNLKNALDNIPWDKIKKTAAKVGKSLATLINGFVEVPELGYIIGKSIGEAINTGIIGINSFLDNTHWDSVGKFIGEGLNGIINTIDWEGLGHLFAAKWNAIFETIGEADRTFDWTNFGKNLASSINTFIKDFKWEENGVYFGDLVKGILDALISVVEEIYWDDLGVKIAEFLNNVDWRGIFEKLGTFVADIINAISDLIINFSDEFEWGGFGSSVGNGINNSLQETDWKQFGEGCGKIVSGLFEMLKSFIDETDWKSLGNAITTTIASFLGNIDWGTVGGTISSFAIGILDFLTGLIQGVDWGAVPQGIIDGISDFFSNLDYAGIFGSVGECIGSAIAAGIDLLLALGEVLSNAWDGVVEYFSGYIEDSGGNIILGLFNGIADAIKGIGSWIKKNIFDPFIKGFKKAFGIHSPSTVMATQGSFIVEGIRKGIIDKWTGFVQFWTEKKDTIINKFKDIKDKFFTKGKDIVSGIKDGIKNLWNNFFQDWSAKKESIVNKFKDIKNNFLEKGKNIVSGIRGGIAEKWSAFSDFWGKKKTNVVDKFKDINSKFLTKGREIISGIKDGIIEKWGGFISDWALKKDSITNTFSNIKSSMMDVGKNIVNGIIDGIKSIWSTLAGWASDIKELFNIKPSVSKGAGVSMVGGGSPRAVSYSAFMPPIPNIPIPQLATGAVIPANREFLAVLGDQKHGRNLEAPENLIRQIVREESAKGMEGGEITIKVPVSINEQVIFEIVKKLDREQYNRTGIPTFSM